MGGSVSDPIIIKIDADIEDARRKLARFEKEAERSAGKIQRSFMKISAAAGQGPARGRTGSRSLAGVSTRPDLRLDRADESLASFGERLADLPGAFVEIRERAGDFGSEIDALGERLGRTNVLFGEQSGLLDGLRGLLPELGREFTTLFEAGAEDGRALNDVIEPLGGTLIDAFEGAVLEGKSFREVLKGIIDDILVISQLPGPGGGLFGGGDSLLGGLLGGIFGGVFGGGGGALGPQFTGTGAEGLLASGSFAKGGAFAGGRSITAFARGGALTNRILRRPTLFPLAGGLGLAGEAGPEAILPLARMTSGELGVKAAMVRLPEASSAGGPVVINEFTIDARGADREGLREVMALIQVVRREGTDTRRMIRPVALSAVLDSRRRGGSIARAFGAR